MANIELAEAQLAILHKVKRSIAPLCGVLPSANMRDKARKIYDIAKQLEEDIKKANPV